MNEPKLRCAICNGPKHDIPFKAVSISKIAKRKGDIGALLLWTKNAKREAFPICEECHYRVIEFLAHRHLDMQFVISVIGHRPLVTIATRTSADKDSEPLKNKKEIRHSFETVVDSKKAKELILRGFNFNVYSP